MPETRSVEEIRTALWPLLDMSHFHFNGVVYDIQLNDSMINEIRRLAGIDPIDSQQHNPASGREGG